ncbi:MULTISPECIES: ABC transporter permease subunit [Bacillaceae]|uniref:ABC transporter permease subunit n=1 Tax=Bacillaceae TaxID=186817 RepID=UPI00104EDFBF|nr:ABC transporter permease subunit [Bacillus sp. CBEL-1]TDB55887.1 ABC transporter permease subunit [Bacillus sp. CBEL-1]
MLNVRPEMRAIYGVTLTIFVLFLVLPIGVLLLNSFQSTKGLSLDNYFNMLSNNELITAFFNSIKVSSLTALITTILAFSIAYALHFTNICKPLKSMIRAGVVIPMLLPTITYGFAIIYSFGNQGLITQILGKALFNIYGFNGLLLGYVIYTLPPAFLLMHNAFVYIDKKFIVVSTLMMDRPGRSFYNTILRPMLGTIGGAAVLSFILSFTDYGIPASIGGTYSVIATQLYQVMLGSIPNFNNGAVIAVLMLVPAAFSVILLKYLDRFNFHYDKFTHIDIVQNRIRDVLLGLLSIAVVGAVISTFLVMFIAPFLVNFPYNLTFTFEHFTTVFSTSNLYEVYKNSAIVASFTTVLGIVIVYSAAILNVRTNLKGRGTFDIVSMVTNTLPGMVLGLSYLLLFNGSSLKGTFIIIIFCNIVHYFTAPYLMAKNSLSKMNPTWEITGGLLGDSWFKTIYRVILPNSLSTITEMFSYYFINSMVTVSGVIFLVSAQTSLVSSKIKELQHFAKFNEIFVLSLLIFGTNILVKCICDYIQKRQFKKA